MEGASLFLIALPMIRDILSERQALRCSGQPPTEKSPNATRCRHRRSACASDPGRAWAYRSACARRATTFSSSKRRLRYAAGLRIRTDTMTHLEIADLTKRYGEVTSVDRLSLAVDRGEFICLLGPSGCGKT